MNFQPPQKRQTSESIIPMINVVFLLLIFFLMTAEITPPEPFEVNLPTAELDQEPKSETVLYVSEEAVLGFEGIVGPKVLDALTAQADKQSPLKLQADGTVAAVEIAKILKILTENGFSNVEVMVGG
ncbi:biopolymer transporter ExbD [Amylibacter sp. SFDW26]|uniref:ExbD/TolR family protein n=1 Tax=Amylibacter sp. SFDW26 TaxID=2652722 RepID=UPI0012623BA2|nr:biopolymer transporter ExbD [Amylibacter sp. SFDW26]KAB7615856.1 biopolymer transporter ExbD [Amylibacter sp. SFDW26]